MAQMFPEDLRADLASFAAPLMLEAIQKARPFTQIDPTDGDQAAADAVRVQALCFAVQALLDTSELTEAGIMVALGAACGTILAQCESNRKALFEMLQHQFAASLAEVGAALLEPQGEA